MRPSAGVREACRRAHGGPTGPPAARWPRVLGLEAVVTLLVPRALAFSDGGLGVTKTVTAGRARAVSMIAAAGLLRRPWGIGVGTALQVLFVLTGIWLLAMLIVGAIFAAIWGRLLFLRRELVGTPGGWRILTS